MHRLYWGTFAPFLRVLGDLNSIFNPENDALTKVDHVKNMLLGLVYQKNLPFDMVLMDTWYAVKSLMLYDR